MKGVSINELGIAKSDLDQLDFEKLSSMKKGEELTSPSQEWEYSRSLKEYPTADAIISHILTTGDETQHIYTKTLQDNGRAVQEAMEKYLENKDYLSSSVLKMADKSPLHLYYEMESGWKDRIRELRKDPSYFKLGTYLHECCLEPTKFSRVVEEPQKDLTSFAGTLPVVEFWEKMYDKEFEGIEGAAETKREEIRKQVSEENLDIDKHKGLKRYYYLLVKNSSYRAVSKEHKIIIDCAKFNFDRYGDGILKRILKHSKREISMYGKDGETGLPVKIRPDSIAFKENIGVDAIISVKTTAMENLREYAYHSAKLNYGLSEGMYQKVASDVTGRDFNVTLNIVIQTVAPYGVMLLLWSPEDIEAGKYKYRHALRTVQECIDKQSWPGYDAFAEEGNMGIIDFSLPQFYKNMEETPISI